MYELFVKNIYKFLAEFLKSLNFLTNRCLKKISIHFLAGAKSQIFKDHIQDMISSYI